jgi:hypothetical protein
MLDWHARREFAGTADPLARYNIPFPSGAIVELTPEQKRARIERAPKWPWGCGLVATSLLIIAAIAWQDLHPHDQSKHTAAFAHGAGPASVR